MRVYLKRIEDMEVIIIEMFIPTANEDNDLRKIENIEILKENMMEKF